MADLLLRSTSSSSSSFHESSSTHKYAPNNFIHLLTLMSLSLAAFAFILQWLGGLLDPVTRFSSDGNEPWPGFSRPVMSSPPSSGFEEILGESKKRQSFPYFRDWKVKFGSDDDEDLLPKICITTTTSAGLEQTLPWIFYHKAIGVTKFFMFVEGEAASPFVSNVLQSLPGVTVINRTKELIEQQQKSRIWNETWTKNVFYRPCNYELFVKQTLNMEMGIVLAREADMNWIFHLDTDELIHPAGTQEYSVQELLHNIPPEVDAVVFTNYESCVERDNIKEPFTEVSLFKKNSDHLPRETYAKYFREVSHGTSNYFLTYGNGKSAARIQDHLRPNGAHRWSNYLKTPMEVEFHEAATLHYTYSKFSDLTSRRDRCNCKLKKENLNRCFFLPFDRDAYVIASTTTKDEMCKWYNEHVVWNSEEVKHKLLKGGLFTRIYSPMVIIKHLKELGVFSAVIAHANQQ